MKRITQCTVAWIVGLIVPLWTSQPAFAAQETDCRQAALAVQVLGSGGPIPDDDRAAAGYLVWVDGRARVLVDAGGGVFLRYGQAGARVEDLDLIALTHLHTDHAADLPALLKGGYFSPRRRPLPVSGPTGNRLFPGTAEFLGDLFDAQSGAFRYLFGFLDGSDGLFRVDPLEIGADAQTPQTVLDSDGLIVAAVGVDHGVVPALGYLVSWKGVKIAFSGDQTAKTEAFGEMIQGADVLFMDHAIPQQAGPAARRLHATPEAIGRLAERAGVKTLVLSHLMARSLAHLDESRAIIQKRYHGPIQLAEDLQCWVL